GGGGGRGGASAGEVARKRAVRQGVLHVEGDRAADRHVAGRDPHRLAGRVVGTRLVEREHRRSRGGGERRRIGQGGIGIASQRGVGDGRHGCTSVSLL